ncbi:MAG: PfkB family carbohydrate kinase [Bacillota bacterium]|nr:PfkB family carbohydrate kinase [Bacillota bacterium]
MIKVVGIGANVYDTLYTVSSYPKEDTKMRAESAVESGGGPCATGLVAASKLGAESAYIGVLSDDAGGQFLKADLERYKVSTDYVDVKSGYASFSSCIWLGKESTSRTCVFNKGNLPPLSLSGKQKQAIADAKVLMVDGNELESAIEGARIAKDNGTAVLYDAGGLYSGVERLLPLADILIPSEEFSLAHTDSKTAEEAAKKLFQMYSPKVVVITQGKKGGLMYDGKEIKIYPATPAIVIDSNGAGDVFHGAFAFAFTKGYDYYKCCLFSSAVSALKCTKLGARAGVPYFEDTIKYLKECGFDEFEKELEK